MSALIETLETRTLFAALPPQALVLKSDVVALFTDAKLAKNDLAGCAKIAAADLRAIKGDLRRLRSQSSNRVLLKTLTTDERVCAHKLKADLAAVLRGGSAAVKRAANDAVKVLRKPTDVRAKAHLAGDLVRLQALGVSGRVATLVADAIACATAQNTALAAIAAANPSDSKTQLDVQTSTTDSNSCSMTAQGDANALDAALNTLIQALPPTT